MLSDAGADGSARRGRLGGESASVSGSNSPALGSTGRAAPFSHTTASGSIFQILAARSRRVWITLLGRLRHDHRRGERDAAAAGQGGEPIELVSPISACTGGSRCRATRRRY